MYFEKKNVVFFDYQLNDNGNNYYHLILRKENNSLETLVFKKELPKGPQRGVYDGMNQDLQEIKDFIVNVNNIIE